MPPVPSAWSCHASISTQGAELYERTLLAALCNDDDDDDDDDAKALLFIMSDRKKNAGTTPFAVFPFPPSRPIDGYKTRNPASFE
jgi:hypothetical protein